MEHVENRTWRLFMSRFLRRGESSEAQEQLQDQLADKLAKLDSTENADSKLRRIIDDASKMWANRSNLRKRDVAYLAAALLYFISPLDAIPDILPGVGYVDDVIVLSAVVNGILRGLSALGSRGKECVEEWIDERTVAVFERFDESATSGVQKTIAAVVVGLWGTTTAAAVSLSIAAALGEYSAPWLAYVILSAVIVIACNAVTAVQCWRAFRKVDGQWQQRLGKLLAAKLTLPHLLALGLPIAILIGLGITRLVLAG
jgi:uncharacterized membrane protein YkvA (DUF1232 family)